MTEGKTLELTLGKSYTDRFGTLLLIALLRSANRGDITQEIGQKILEEMLTLNELMTETELKAPLFGDLPSPQETV